MLLKQLADARLLYSSDQSVLVDFGSPKDPATRHRVIAAARKLAAFSIPGLVNLHPAYATVLVVFDPVLTSADEIVGRIALALAAHTGEPETTAPCRLVEIPVQYGGEDGPDLGWVAEHHRMTPADVIERHSSVDYEVCFLGFAPGFAYLTGLPESLETPRLDSPRKLVPAGSVGIAGRQTGVYPAASPGGWRLIGRTTLEMFHPARNPMSLLQPGDTVRFLPL